MLKPQDEYRSGKEHCEPDLQPSDVASMDDIVGKNGFEHNNLAIFKLKLHWVP